MQIEKSNADRRIVECASKALFALTQVFFDPSALADIDDHDHDGPLTVWIDVRLIRDGIMTVAFRGMFRLESQLVGNTVSGKGTVEARLDLVPALAKDIGNQSSHNHRAWKMQELGVRFIGKSIDISRLNDRKTDMGRSGDGAQQAFSVPQYVLDLLALRYVCRDSAQGIGNAFRISEQEFVREIRVHAVRLLDFFFDHLALPGTPYHQIIASELISQRRGKQFIFRFSGGLRAIDAQRSGTLLIHKEVAPIRSLDKDRRRRSI